MKEVKHPSHYNKGIEVWKFIRSWSMGFFAGNIIKYVARYPYKNGVQDLYKAKEYLDELIDYEEKATGKHEATSHEDLAKVFEESDFHATPVVGEVDSKAYKTDTRRKERLYAGDL